MLNARWIRLFTERIFNPPGINKLFVPTHFYFLRLIVHPKISAHKKIGPLINVRGPL